MKPLLTLTLSALSLATVAAAVPSVQAQLLNAVIATAWAQQERDRDKDKDREERDQDKDRGRGNDRDREDRDNDRGGGNDREREARDSDRGGDNDREREERGNDRGGNDREREARDSDRGGGNDREREARDSDRGGTNDQEREERGNDRGNTNDGESEDRDNDRGGSNEDANDRSTDDGSSGSGSNSDNKNNNDQPNADLADRGAEPDDRITGDDPDADTAEFADRFDLDDTETFDDDGFLTRRGEIIAMSRDTLLPRRAVALGLEVVQQESLASLNTTMYRLSVPAASPIDGILARLRAQDPEGVFDRNHLYERSASAAANSPGAPSRALMDTAQGVSVGLIDTGVDALHPALAGTHVELSYFVDQSRVLPEAHGTAVVSLLVSPEFGVLPNAQLYVACVFYEDRRGGSLSEARDLVRALDWLMKRRAPVINMSLAGPPNEVLKAAIERAVEAGHLVVAAVGNGGPASPPLYPAAYDGVIAVTAVDGEQQIYRRANRGAHVQLAAMGVDVLAAAPAGVANYSGTSFASPYVAALAAMEYPSLDPQKVLAVKESLRDNALDLGKPGRDEVYGFGLARPRAIATVAR